ncbi:transposase [Oryzomonas rubra]|uniref:Transposase IS116/IS110/IS902 C-terminal domain-containing protein n=1 Tax=Oryzomonas rubra TaxID=2509454 RepID=A0A5A9X6S6_9BACT|nr:transposase [Oryzomonas rubra]KAA0888726.1 hypothetical protein ET418_15205 [Oryzomonas rubra]
MPAGNFKTIVRGCYDIQQLRIQTGNRIVGNFKAKLGQAPGQSEDTLDDESKAMLDQIRVNNKRVATGAVDELEQEDKKAKKVAGFVTKLLEKHYAMLAPDGLPQKKKFAGDAVISDYTEIALISQYKELESQEAKHFRNLGKILEDYPIYTEFMEKVKGIGPAMAGVIISEIDITKARHPSSLWKYAGLDVADDGRGRSRRKEHLQTVAYIDRDGHDATRNGITFNPFLKTKLTGVLASSFLRAGDNKYRQIYDDYKHRLESHENWQDKKVPNEKTGKDKIASEKAHRHNAAMRYMVKIFLIDLYTAWRALEGLPVSAPYQDAKLGYVHGGEKQAA